jgi:hypothetical protein
LKKKGEKKERRKEKKKKIESYLRMERVVHAHVVHVVAEGGHHQDEDVNVLHVIA